MTKTEALEKMAKYCAYQERCQSDVRLKLLNSGLDRDEIEDVICQLIEQDFVNEERFAKAFTRGKFRHKGWGKIKIKQYLIQKGISDYCLKKGFEEINESEYLIKLKEILYKKINSLSETNKFISNQKAAKYAISKGYESSLVWDILNC